MAKQRDETGRYTTVADPDDVLDVLDVVEGPVITTADVVDHLDVSTETARRKLNGLDDDGVLAKRKTAGRIVYWRPDRDGGDPSAESFLDPVDPRETPA
jgi:Fic family protein